jgi:hypothetical protein
MKQNRAGSNGQSRGLSICLDRIVRDYDRNAAQATIGAYKRFFGVRVMIPDFALTHRKDARRAVPQPDSAGVRGRESHRKCFARRAQRGAVLQE